MITAIVLAAGLSRRMGSANSKLLAPIDGTPMIRRSVEPLFACAIDEVIVVTGHGRPDIEAALSGLALRFVANPDYAAGMGSSLAAGAAAVRANADAVMVCLGDMPLVAPSTILSLTGAFAGATDRICVPVLEGRRGHPVLFASAWLPALARLSGDSGARRILDSAGAFLLEVPVDDPGVLRDFDTPEQLAELENGRH